MCKFVIGLLWDSENNFEWASIAAIVSIFTLILSVYSIRVTQNQGNKNRKSTTLAQLRVEQLKEVRKNVSGLINSLHQLDYLVSIMKQRGSSVNEAMIPERFIFHKNELFALLYQDNEHTKSLIKELSEFENKLIKNKEFMEIPLLIQKFDDATKEYSRTEYKEIEKYI